MDASQISFGVAFLAGLASFLSPCVLPLVPIYLAQLVGQSIYQSTVGQEEQPSRFYTFLHATMFVLGFMLAFVSLGATASTLGSFLQPYQPLLRRVGGIILVIFGLYLAGVLKWSLFAWQKHIEFHPRRPSFAASLLIGIIFAFGWTPCVGLILGPILGLAANAATLRQGVMLLLFYSLGLGLPFLLMGLGIDQFSRVLTWLKPHVGKIEIATGIVMIAAGMLIFFNLLPYFNQYFNLGVIPT
ncbi:MAG: cytochrome c biogenesis protein CcdA [Chloroflexi bacterium]|nr:cytochrome c biogenesis protein CcdA [Ktedonobacteraceae bacterium]MBV9707430.1 cytochrome c biogenesis protein CcdA [Chloroflexota bacterium]